MFGINSYGVIMNDTLLLELSATMLVSISGENVKELKEPLTSGAGGEVIWTKNQLKTSWHHFQPPEPVSHVLIRQRINQRFSPRMPNWIQSTVVVPGAAGNLDKGPNDVTLRFLKGSWLNRLWISPGTSQEPARGSLWFGLTVKIVADFLSNNPKFNRQIVSAVVCRFVLLKTALLLIHSNWSSVSKRHTAVEFFNNLLSKLWAPQKKVPPTPPSNTERETSGQSISKQNYPQIAGGKLW